MLLFNTNYMSTFFINKKITFNNKILDRYQTKAVLCKKANYLIIAGAGSGKTLTIAAKIKYLLENNVKESEILCISFTNETVNSIKATLNNNLIDVDVMTFHRLSLGILNNSFNIAAPDLLEYTTNEFFESFIYHDNTYKILNYISNKNNLRQLINTFIMHMKALDFKEDYLYELINNKIEQKNNFQINYSLWSSPPKIPTSLRKFSFFSIGLNSDSRYRTFYLLSFIYQNNILILQT